MGDFLAAEGFDVKRFVDDQKPVKAEDIFDAIDGYVSAGTIKQLIVYFAGHGSFVGTGEYWLLSQALHNSNQAVSLTQCVQFARQCGIPNVVLISDACRSTSVSLNIQALTGYNIIPVTNNRRVFTYLDTFFAVRQGAPAYEVRDAAGGYQGIYTSCFLDAYVNPDDSMVDTVDGVKVVPNKRLETFLLSEVPKRAQISDVQEYPDSSVTSSGFIGRAETDEIWAHPDFHHRQYGGGAGCRCGGCRGCRTNSRPKIGKVPATISDLVESQLGQAGLHISKNLQPGTFSAPELKKIDDDLGFTASRDRILNARGPNVFRSGVGFNIFGTRIRAAAGSKGPALVLRDGNGATEPATIQIDLQKAGQATVALEFEEGSGAVIAALQGYVANVVVEKARVTSVCYEPAEVGQALATRPVDKQSTAELRAVVATAAKFGAFRIDGPSEVQDKNAAALLDIVLAGKPFDPTLGMYAAYACAQAGLADQLVRIYKMMKSELKVDLFDVSMLAGGGAKEILGTEVRALVPFSPMLNQGWQFLGVRNVTLAPSLAAVQGHVLPSLWTTFDPEGMSIVKGELGIRSPQ
jgi:hypothetical protein